MTGDVFIAPAIDPSDAPQPITQRGLVRAATIIAAGNIASRVLGLGREAVIAYLFGATGQVSAFRVASTLVQQLYDFLVGGMASAALVPLFSEYAARKDRRELWSVASVVINTLAILVAAAVLLLELAAPALAWIYGAGYDPELKSQIVRNIQWALPAVFFLGLSGVVTGLLYSLKRFTYPALTAAAFNASIIVVAIVLAPHLGILSLLVGIVAGSAVQVVLQLPGLRDMSYRWTIDFGHPVLRRILKLYVPVIGGLAIAQVGVAVDRYLVSFTGSQSLSWMQDATVLAQLPLGLVAMAISFAILPELSRQSALLSGTGEESERALAGFQSTLAFGIKLVVLFMIPAVVGLFVLAYPVVALLFEHGAFTSNDTIMTAMVLRLYLVSIPFAAIDQPLIFAFYARKDTVTPNVVAFASVGIYLVVALILIRPLGMVGLVVANVAQTAAHALIMIWLLNTRLGGLGESGTGSVSIKVAVAVTAMGLVVFAIERAVGPIWLKALLPTAVGGGVYVAGLWLLRVQEIERVLQLVQARIHRV